MRSPMRRRYYNLTVALIAVNVLVFILTYASRSAFYHLSLIPAWVIREGYLWQLLSYMFVHGSIWHILLNMLVLFLFGMPVERTLGSIEFMAYYLVCGVGAGVATLLINWYAAPRMAMVPVVGASGAVYALLLAYAALFPDSTIFVFGILPVRAPVAVLIFAAISIVSQVIGAGPGIAHLTHLAGIVFGILYFLIRLRINPIRAMFRR